MNINKNIPTVFATGMAEAADITYNIRTGENHREYSLRNERLSMFQQMSITVPFDEALICFYGQKLSTKQKKVLKVIYDSTRPWMLSHVVGVLLDKLDGNILEKDFGESTKILIEQLTGESTSPDKKGANVPQMGLLIKLTDS